MLSGFAIFFGMITGAVAWIIKVAIDKRLDEKVYPLLAELKNNGGKSLKDTVDKIYLTVQGLVKTDGEHNARIEALEDETFE